MSNETVTPDGAVVNDTAQAVTAVVSDQNASGVPSPAPAANAGEQDQSQPAPAAQSEEKRPPLSDISAAGLPPETLEWGSSRIVGYKHEVVSIAESVPEVKGPFKDLDDYLERAVRHVDRLCRVYSIVGHEVKVVIPEDYALKLDEVRALRKRVEELELRCKHAETDAVAACDAELVTARRALNDHVHHLRVLPDDMVRYFDQLLYSVYFRRFMLLDQPNANDLFVQLTWDRSFTSAAAAQFDGTEFTGDIAFFRTERNEFVRQNVFHEWCHRLEHKMPHIFKLFGYALDLDLARKNWAPRPYAYRSYQEHWAVVGEELVGAEAWRFTDVAENAPLRTAVWMVAFKQALVLSLVHRPSICSYQFFERVAYTEKVVVPRALAILRGLSFPEGDKRIAEVKALIDLLTA